MVSISLVKSAVYPFVVIMFLFHKHDDSSCFVFSAPVSWLSVRLCIDSPLGITGHWCLFFLCLCNNLSAVLSWERYSVWIAGCWCLFLRLVLPEWFCLSVGYLSCRAAISTLDSVQGPGQVCRQIFISNAAFLASLLNDPGSQEEPWQLLAMLISDPRSGTQPAQGRPWQRALGKSPPKILSLSSLAVTHKFQARLPFRVDSNFPQTGECASAWLESW